MEHDDAVPDDTGSPTSEASDATIDVSAQQPD